MLDRSSGDDAGAGCATRPVTAGQVDSGVRGRLSSPAGLSETDFLAPDDWLTFGLNNGPASAASLPLAEHASWALEDWVWNPASLVRCHGALGSPG